MWGTGGGIFPFIYLPTYIEAYLEPRGYFLGGGWGGGEMGKGKGGRGGGELNLNKKEGIYKYTCKTC